MSILHLKLARLGLAFSLGVPSQYCPCYGHRTYNPFISGTSQVPPFPFFDPEIYGTGEVLEIDYVDTVRVGGIEVDLTCWCSDGD